MFLLMTSKGRSFANLDFRSKHESYKPKATQAMRKHFWCKSRSLRDLHVRIISYTVHLSIVRHNSRHGLSDTLDPRLSRTS